MEKLFSGITPTWNEEENVMLGRRAGNFSFRST